MSKLSELVTFHLMMKLQFSDHLNSKIDPLVVSGAILEWVVFPLRFLEVHGSLSA